MILRTLFLAALLAGSALADETNEQASLQSFAAAHPDCVEWSDGCAVCRRDTAMHCSLPGIACQPSAIACKRP